MTVSERMLFTVHPKHSLSDVEYSRHINVMCFWMVRDKLGKRTRAPLTYNCGSGTLLVEVAIDRSWDDVAMPPFIQFAFDQNHLRATSYDGTVADSGNEDLGEFTIDYGTPDLLVAVRDAVVKWAESCKRIPGRWADALKGDPRGYLFIRR